MRMLQRFLDLNLYLASFYIILTIALITNSNINAKALTKENLIELKKDQEIYDKFHSNLVQLSCKMLAYLKIKTLYDDEIIDTYLNQTRYKRTFLNSLNSEMIAFCLKNDLDDKYLLKDGLVYSRFDKEYEKFVNVDYSEILKKVNGEKSGNGKQDL